MKMVRCPRCVALFVAETPCLLCGGSGELPALAARLYLEGLRAAIPDLCFVYSKN